MQTALSGPDRPDVISASAKHSSPISTIDNFFASGAALSLMSYAGLVSLLVLNIFKLTQGHFNYTLDDPYIHLALAERIRHGLYGLNAGEAASPSSSILWPLLLVPFAGFRIMTYVPFILNFVFGSATVVLLSFCMQKVFLGHREKVQPGVRLLGILLIPALNLPGLTLTGMEHVLQVMLSVCCAYGVICLMIDGEMPLWTMTAAVILPSVRYEGILITVAVAASLCGVRNFRAGMTILVSSSILPVAFGLYLRHLGLPFFPLSVLMKSRGAVLGEGSIGHRVAVTLFSKCMSTLRESERTPELILAIALGYLTYRNRNNPKRFACIASGAIVALVQVTIGTNGWFYRYEIFALAFTVVLAIAAEFSVPASTDGAPPARAALGILLVAVAGLATTYMTPLFITPPASANIFEQQRQLGNLTRDFYHGAVAINGLGMVSFKRSSDNYVLDLAGLGSKEVAMTDPSKRTLQWLENITREHHIGLVAVYPEWFPSGFPAGWTKVAKLCSANVGTAYSARVMLYGADPSDLVRLESAIQAFSKTMAAGTKIQMYPSDSDNVCKP